MSKAYKKFTAQDYAIVPFNAHKQYSYGSSSAASNRVTHYATKWTSESISLYSSASTNPKGVFDPINTIKYNQIDHLFYKDFLTNHANLFGDFHYQYHKRNLYEKANVLSIPEGLYGEGIKPGSFYLSSSNHIIVDDGYGNLISQSSDIHNYPTDLRANVFRLDPIKGFRNYDLSLFDDYALKILDPQHPEEGTHKVFWKKGKINPNAPKTYSTHGDLQEIDDSYFLNRFKYKAVNFNTSSLGDDNHKFPCITLNSVTGSRILVPHDERFNFDTKKDFAVSFNMKPNTLNYEGVGVPLTIKHQFQGGYVFNITGDYAYIVKPELQTNLGSNIVKNGTFDDTSYWNLTDLGNGSGTGWIIADGKLSRASSGGSNDWAQQTGNTIIVGRAYQVTFNLVRTAGHVIIDSQALGAQQFTTTGTHTDIFVATTSTFQFMAGTAFRGSIDNVSIKEISLFDNNLGVSTSGNTGIGGGETLTDSMADSIEFLANKIDKKNAGYNWWLPNKNELNEILSVLKPYTNKNFIGINNDNKKVKSLEAIENQLVISEQASNTEFQKYNELLPINNNYQTYINHNKDEPTILQYLLVRKVNIASLDNYRRDIIGKSTTKTIIPSAMEGRSEILNTSVSGNMQPMDIPAGSQFPFEIYMQNNTLYFDRADSYKKESISYDLTTGGGIPTNLSHILCQHSASYLEIYVNGDKKSSLKSTLTEPTRNRANLYIGSKGTISKPDSSFTNDSIRYFNGNLSNINIWENSFTSPQINAVSESINASPYVGNIFYKNGFVTITHPNYYSVLGDVGVGEMEVGSDFAVDSSFHTGISKLEFQGTHKIREWEYQCTVEEHEFNGTQNISARKSRSNNVYELAPFTTSSIFKPYITTIGLYDEDNNLLVVGKLNQPIKTSNQTDTTFIVRWDT
tara:strand:- start:904 stop:3633 length:2730 start_codon:yes stop_codon:yes gene_type:complete